MTLPFHPLADLFPLMEGPEFDELMASIKANGLREPITTSDGYILDGRNRYRACEAAGVEPRYKEYIGDDRAAFVTDMNLRRRNLTLQQRAMIAGRMANMPDGNPNLKKPTGARASVGRDMAAKLMDVSVDSVSRAKTILSRGTPEEIRQVESGEAALKPVAKAVRKRTSASPNEPDDVKKKPSFDKQRAAKVWGILRGAIVAINDMPRPLDAVPLVRAISRGPWLKDNLDNAVLWLMMFQEEWEKANGKK